MIFNQESSAFESQDQIYFVQNFEKNKKKVSAKEATLI